MMVEVVVEKNKKERKISKKSWWWLASGVGWVPLWWRHEGGAKDVGGRVAGFVLQCKVEWSGVMTLCGSC
jgi:hypothetical protein